MHLETTFGPPCLLAFMVSVVYFDQRTGVSLTVRWFLSSFSAAWHLLDITNGKKQRKLKKERKKSQKTEKGVYQHLGATIKTLKIIILIREQHAKHPLTGPNTQQCPFLSVKAILRTQLWAVFAILRQSLQGAFKNTHYFDLLLEAFKFKNLFLPQYKDKFTTCPLASKMF